MDLVKEGFQVLYVWGGQATEEIEKHVLELKTKAKVQLENVERLEFCKFLFFCKSTH
jgi:hypothetical protein